MSDLVLRREAVGKSFGRFTALRGVSASFRRGALTAIIGPNGAGKSTFFNVISGAFPPSAGRVEFEGRDITGTPQHRFARMGIAKSFQITTVFAQLSALENVRVALQALASRFDAWQPRSRLPGLVEQAGELLALVGLLPHRDRPAGTLAHGEQQMLAIARAMVSKPKLVMLDEPSEGIMPVLVDEMFALFRQMRAEGTTIRLVEQNVELALGIADSAYVMDQGTVVHHAPAAALLQDTAVQERYCSV